MQKLNYTTTIAIDTDRSEFHFYLMSGDDKSTIAHNIKKYSAPQFEEDFFNQFKDAIKEFATNNPSDSVRKVNVVLPDSVVVTDVIKVPTMKGSMQMKKTLDTTLGGLYRNYKDLRVASHTLQQNKQYTTIAISAVQKKIVSAIFAACSENKFLVDTLTYASSATVAGAVALNSKLKGATYLLLDVKDEYSRFVFVLNGRAVGYYPLPFGLDFLRRHRVTQEDMLFDHSLAELTVLSVKEKAKAQEADLSLDEDDIERVEEDLSGGASAQNRSDPLKKTPRRLPEFMLREVPKGKDGALCENFRVFVKWALTLIAENTSIVELGAPEFVCVNLPRELSLAIDSANSEAEESGISFIPLTTENEKPKVLSNVELYGSLFPKQITSAGKF